MIQIQAGHLPLFLLWFLVGLSRWYYARIYNKAAFAYLHNLVRSSRLWAIIGMYELIPWLVALVSISLFHAAGS